ncbi:MULTISPECIES: MinD/ParA family protein [Pseudoalteromonas]|jgi:flagellar biosynthesis protein FlhG|uniref:Cobyrinic acid a,c-diamide synthase n=2 Tax=Pseudoalteromonas aliena TaxID=247523 RepID=A0A1Q2GZL8_9GAMM|nr:MULTISPECIES: MinD/ParA family protein [Pseudoalteromonas]AQQ00569.1 cobyrinic acid a,c-diamide synthase [Pseudoalteromonas aliena]MBB1384209.1 MinD/ParA family protein [Pseudoalteromonas sp. SG45-5]MBB1392511.1 MinD/ParA family protein [Pseudoalteromonas sp. SG44-4]MBB1447391.1 MinD/ParA family protein [Pseudoalteromonas sp. SG41-6]MBE0360223.1 flagellar biosynthesis protein FlhG [Pseudoalteromonas aliena SW19]
MINTVLDQASGLRKMSQNNNNGVKVIAVTGGKGGVGKTNVSLNTAIALGQQGKRVLVLDADLGLANCDVMLGLRVERNLSHVLSGECELDEILVEGPAGIKIVPATSGSQNMVELSPSEHAGLIRAFSELNTEFDILIVDTAAGISDMVLSFSRAAQDVMVVVCDEPTSITDAYALIKVLSREHGVYKFKIVANMVRSLREGQELFAKLSKVTDRFLDISMELAATIPYDENMRKATRRQKVIVELFPSSPASVAFRALATKAVKWPIPNQPSGHLEFFIEKLVNG